MLPNDPLRTLPALAVLMLVGTVSSAAADQGEPALAVEARAVPTSVSSVAVGGTWGENGFFRLVVMRGGLEHVHFATYAQWITEPTSKETEPKLEKSVEVRDLSNQLTLGVGDARFVSGSKDSGVFEAEAFDNESGRKSIARVHMGKPGEVSVEMPPSSRPE